VRFNGQQPSNNGREAELEREMLQTIYDATRKSSIAWTLGQSRRIAWLLRDRFSADAWRILHRFSQQFHARPLNDTLQLASTLNLLDDALMILSAFGGLAAESMTRGDGWRFLEIGRRLERVLQMIELLSKGLVPDAPELGADLQSLLEIADSSLTYRSRYLTSIQADPVIDLLLLDEANPRSAAFQLLRLHEHVDALPAREERGRPSGETKIVLRMLTAVQLAEASDLIRGEGWPEFNRLLNNLGNGMRLLSETLARHYFEHTVAPRPLTAL
jgi:uncharacterized alpha-E superfamily protein